MKQSIQDSVRGFRLPRYAELPTVGLYLEQVAKYINGYLDAIGCADITTSMISNYVKKGYVASPQKKQYGADQIAYLLFIAISKNVLSLENIIPLFDMQKKTYTLPVAYDYFCAELENMVATVFGLKPEPENLGVTNTDEKNLLRYIIISVSHSLFLAACFRELKKKEDTDEKV